MILSMEFFQHPPFVYGVTTLDGFIADQHYRRRFLGKYSPKYFRKIKKCKNEMCTNYHDNKDSYCSDVCRSVWEQEMVDRRYGDGHKDYGHLRCGNCQFYVPHPSRFKAFKGQCVEEMVNNNEIEHLVAPDDWCHFFSKKATQRNRQ